MVTFQQSCYVIFTFYLTFNWHYRTIPISLVKCNRHILQVWFIKWSCSLRRELSRKKRWRRPRKLPWMESKISGIISNFFLIKCNSGALLQLAKMHYTHNTNTVSLSFTHPWNLIITFFVTFHACQGECFENKFVYPLNIYIVETSRPRQSTGSAKISCIE